MSEKRQVKIPFGAIMLLLERYGPLLEYFEDETKGYETLLVKLHGKRPVKVGPVGRMKVLEPIEYTVDVSRAAMHPEGETQDENI
jgi:hypothetical protein